MREYSKDFEGVTYKFTEKDLSAPFSTVLADIKDDILNAKETMGNRYTEEIEVKVQKVLDAYIHSAFKFQLELQSIIIRWSQEVTPQTSLHKGKSIGSFANDSTMHCKNLQLFVVDYLRKIGLPIQKQML